MSEQAFVSVVTPVYNGAKYLAACVESVLAQSYGAFEMIVLDNASSDETNAIVASYAAADSRIKLFRNDATLPLIENWNRAVELMSPDSVYCKTLHADDLMYPQCLARMVALAEANPGVGVVGSLRLRGEGVECEGMPAGREIFTGKETARMFLRREVFGFAPTSGMIRSDLVRARRPFYPVKYLHADLAAYFDLLDQTDFGFINEVLCFSRTHEDSITTTVAQRRQTLMREWVFLLQEFGPRYFEPQELATLEREHLRRYYRMLLRSALTHRDPGFLRYHLSGLREAGRLPGAGAALGALAAEIRACAAHPGKMYAHLRRSPPRR